jgi:hypothetical protein
MLACCHAEFLRGDFGDGYTYEPTRAASEH